MFIVFEGIDGSGKTTLSNRVAQRLARLGRRVAHAREGGELRSATARRIRELTRDARLLEMTPQAEFLLNTARDAQQLAEVIKPALARGAICIADRYLYSQRALSAAGRGLSEQQLRPALELASQGIWPDLVILIDVDPELARLRKRLGKLVERREDQTDSRKGLAGAGLAARAREAYLTMAREDPSRWLVFENNHEPLWVLEQRIVEAVLGRLEGRESPRVAPPRSPPPPRVTSQTVERHFFEALDELERRELALCALLLTGIPGWLAHQRRLAYAERFPELVAWGLGSLRDPDSLALRRVLATRAPREVASNLTGDDSGEAMALRHSLMKLARPQVLGSLKRLDTPEAWRLREQALREGYLVEVLPGLAGLDVPRAWELRERGVAKRLLPEVARSLGGISGERADALRGQLADREPLSALRSTAGLDSAFIRGLRERLFPLAPKVVLRSLTGVSAPYAYALRERAAPLTKEAIDSVDGLDDEQAWSLRDRFALKWSSTTVSSVKQLAATPRAQALIDRVLEACPGRMPVLRNAYAVLAKARAAQSASSRAPALEAIRGGGLPA